MPNEYGITAKEATRSINHRHAIITTARERGYRTYKRNPTLNWWQKWKLIRQIKGR